MAQAVEGSYPVSNHTKWMELRDVVLALDVADRPEFRSRCLLYGYVSNWDREWFYHFVDGGFADLEWIELRGSCLADASFQGRVAKIGLVGQVLGGTVRILGYAKCGELCEMLTFSK